MFPSAKKIGKDQLRSVVSIGEIEQASEETHKEVADRSQGMRTKAQHIHNAKTYAVRYNFGTVDFVMVYQGYARHNNLSTG